MQLNSTNNINKPHLFKFLLLPNPNQSTTNNTKAQKQTQHHQPNKPTLQVKQAKQQINKQPNQHNITNPPPISNQPKANKQKLTKHPNSPTTPSKHTQTTANTKQTTKPIQTHIVTTQVTL